MSEPRHEFDETSISGYLDGELTQRDDQRVRLHLEDCAECRAIADGMRKMKEATMTSEFQVPDDTQWDEKPRGSISAFLSRFGWTIAIVWVIAIAGYGIWQVATDAEDLLEAVLVFGLWLGFGLVFLSVLIDRLKTFKTDPYRRIEK
ncbi:MAG TPA: anti-sigma factor [Gemmatimonadota bacterium]|jgi:anti-sigma factor RsiW|nr:anti-sigma factor [Gemmatimonadota bacterium]